MQYISKRFLSNDYDEADSIVVLGATQDPEHIGEWQAKNVYVPVHVELRDAEKAIYLDFSLDREHSLDSRLDKIDVLIDELKKLKTVLPQLAVQAQIDATEWLAKQLEEQKDEHERPE